MEIKLGLNKGYRDKFESSKGSKTKPESIKSCGDKPELTDVFED